MSSHAYRTLLSPHESVLVLIDHQPRMLAGGSSGEREALCNNVAGLARTANAFGVPTVLTGIAPEAFGGTLLQELTDVFRDRRVISRTLINAWADRGVRDAVLATGRRQIIIAGLWSEVGVVLPALSALEEGREVYVVADASGGTSAEAHRLGLQRVTQAGGVPLTWLQLLGEFQRDWAGEETHATVESILHAHGGAWGRGVGMGRGAAVRGTERDAS
ncbi:isochorismatase family protein [Streptomyces sp. NPDC008122]|uniref:hydrolase n=1 Tax=Streptomyces sp. NPDC008122 TaxID=3364810 RepID=UPI0036E5E541